MGKNTPLVFLSCSKSVSLSLSLFLVFPERAPSNASELTADEKLLGVEPGSDRHAGMQAGYQLALLVTTLAVSIVGGLLTGKYFSTHLITVSLLIVSYYCNFEPGNTVFLALHRVSFRFIFFGNKITLCS